MSTVQITELVGAARRKLIVTPPGGAAVNHGRVTLRMEGPTVQAVGRRRVVVAEGVIASSEGTARRAEFTMADGSVWQVTVGCGCSGG